MKHPRLTGLAVTATAMAVAVAPAHARDTPTTVSITGGKTTLFANSATVEALKAKHIKVKGKNFPITGGNVDPATLAGTLDHSGKLKFKRRKATVAFTALTVTGASLSGTVAGKTLRLAKLSGGKVALDGFDPTAKGISAALTKKAAKALNRSFGVKAFKKGAKLGKLSITTVAGQALLAFGTTTIVLNPQLAGGLAAQGTQLAPVAPATLNPATLTLTLPVNGGVVALEDGQETFLGHDGGVSVAKGYNPPIPITGFSWSLGVERPILGINSPLELPFGDVTGAAPTVDTAAKTVKATGLEVKLTAEAAQALQTLGVTLPAGAVVGTGAFDATIK
jgi:hypothetical protein